MIHPKFCAFLRFCAQSPCEGHIYEAMEWWNFGIFPLQLRNVSPCKQNPCEKWAAVSCSQGVSQVRRDFGSFSPGRAGPGPRHSSQGLSPCPACPVLSSFQLVTVSPILAAELQTQPNEGWTKANNRLPSPGGYVSVGAALGTLLPHDVPVFCWDLLSRAASRSVSNARGWSLSQLQGCSHPC